MCDAASLSSAFALAPTAAEELCTQDELLLRAVAAGRPLLQDRLNLILQVFARPDGLIDAAAVRGSGLDCYVVDAAAARLSEGQAVMMELEYSVCAANKAFDDERATDPEDEWATESSDDDQPKAAVKRLVLGTTRCSELACGTPPL
jgi:hypothetical protein